MTTQMSFATRSEGPLQEVTERRPRLAIDAYPMGRLLLLRCFGDVDGLDGAAEINGSGGKVLHATRTGDEVTLLLDGTGREEEIIASLADQSAHLIPPIRWQNGEARVTLILEDGADPQALLDQFPGARLVSKRRPILARGDRVAYSSPLFLPKLTEKQARGLLEVQSRTRTVRPARGPGGSRSRGEAGSQSSVGDGGIGAPISGPDPRTCPHGKGRSAGHSARPRGRAVRAGGPRVLADDSSGRDDHVR